VSRDVAAKLLIAAGDNGDRIRTESGFAALCGVNPVKASSGKTNRHRLNRCGDHQANNALWVIATVRLSRDPETRDYRDRRKTKGLSHREIVRYLKRYLARRLYPILLNDRYPQYRSEYQCPVTASRRSRGGWLVEPVVSIGDHRPNPAGPRG
jgi:transposase